MKIYVCEQFHEGDCGIFATFEAANKHFESCGNCEYLNEYELVEDKFEQLEDSIEIRKWSCSGCHKEFRSDVARPYNNYPLVCSEKCANDYRERCSEHSISKTIL